MKVNKALLTALLLTASLAVSCAVEPKEDSDTAYDHIMTAWIRVNHPGVKPYGTYGAYILEMDKGDGGAIGDSAYIRVHYTKRSLDGTITDTNVEELAEQLGLNGNTACYDGNVWRMTQGYLPDALEEVLRTMRGGGNAAIALPMSASSHLSVMYDAFSTTSESNNYVYEIAVDTVITDIIDYQDQVMRAFFREHFDSESTIADHHFFKKIEEKTEPADTIPEGNTVRVRYIGRLLNGQVFDTNIEDTAKFYRIWSNKSTYDAMSIAFYKNSEDQFDNNNSVIKGFGQSILKMNYGEKVVTVFNSDLAYGAEGSNPAIPEYSPLFFWLYVEPKD